MRVIIVALMILFAAPQLIAQNNIMFNLKPAEKRGDLLFENYSYQRSLDAYQQALEKEPEADRLKLKIAECYRMLNRPHLAEDWYAQVVEKEEVTESIHKLHYAQVLSSNGKYAEAEKWYKAYGGENAGDSRINRKLEMLEKIHTLMADSLVFLVDALSINSEKSDFSPTFYQNGLVFVSGRDQNKAINNVYN